MKYFTSVILTAALVLGSMHVTSCSSAFTKSDAQALGVQVATQSLAVASKVVAGEKVDLKTEIAAIGLQAAASAVNTVTYNIAKNPNATPLSIVSDSHAQAQAAIAATSAPNPAVASQAAAIATQAIAAAQAHLNATTPPTAATAPTGN